ncbi:N-alpha-acetyltransferase 38, NatC auxiliary subunit [Trichoplax sp. H2]|nr:N-alpha-acetyltransferase 38, NatC auxiliary subunit [Trichoplax sp. H2]|eukprot:RDD42425.1 N-alpha-acetyltransferase 38, NatC auxiliary subunit [Trichoplax sp. H2]
MLDKLLNKLLQVHLSDGRVVVGNFMCTDRELNIILGQCQEYSSAPDPESTEQPRTLGLAMIPGKHVIKIQVGIDVD